MAWLPEPLPPLQPIAVCANFLTYLGEDREVTGASWEACPMLPLLLLAKGKEWQTQFGSCIQPAVPTTVLERSHGQSFTYCLMAALGCRGRTGAELKRSLKSEVLITQNNMLPLGAWI